MKLKMLVAAASLVVAGSAMAGAPALPGGDLGALTPTPALFLGTGAFATGGTIADTYTFSVGGNSDLIGSIGGYGATFSSVLIDGVATSLTSTTTGYGFSFTGLSSGSHTLKVEGAFPSIYTYIGSVYSTPSAVPEPESLALIFAGLGVVGLVARRRQAV
ncbi:FxDxF family PEP-CTERM protein [Aquabacterium sp. CECT 9606]|uniref:FxDxF family PEP-CTERM protein n=1 Tax=Aquabacterium sp. CECT 9606 TaxID=2845822 RepID=UPI001E2C0759|nr:FxDxF family PEP-CTERM protein [Aquabacterium sp. CECT 9606]CAH0351434.1 hypothetical protein AQB9606_02095 [Aquabacterium sp. CECT 9606]